MKIYKSFNIDKKFQNSVIAIGNFDGIHAGHQKIFNQAKRLAKSKKIKFGVITFEPIPRAFFKKLRNYRINSIDQKISIMKKLNIDFLIIQKFDKEFSKVDYLRFIKKNIYLKTKAKYILVGNNFRFGKNREGNIKKLKKFESNFLYKVKVIKPLKMLNKVISSTKIRNYLKNGNIINANRFLKRNWTIQGKVIKGMKRGREIGFPTCNINLKDYLIPKLGVYSVDVGLKGSKGFYKGIANVGYRPTFGVNDINLEVNIFGFNQNLYNKNIRVLFKKFIRPEKKFKNINELKSQIIKDLKKI